MKKITLFTLFLFFSAVCICFPCELIVRVPMGNTYPPFFEQDQTGRWGGLSIELAEVLLAEAGCKPVYQSLPFPRALEDLKKGKIHLMLNLTATDERRQFTHFIGPQLDETVVLVIRKNLNLDIASLDDLKKLPKSIGVERGKVYGKAFEQKRLTDEAFRKKLEEVTEVNLLELMLEKGRISGFLGYGYNVFYRLKTDPSYANFTVHPYPINQDWVYFGFSKQAVPGDLLKRLQTAYDCLQAKGTFEKIKQRYRFSN
jgi:polar amino acid transport system substrate-binding protein